MDKIKSRLNYLGYALLAFIIGYPHLKLTYYALPGADDFSCANAVEIYRQNHNALVSALLYTRDVYITWQGTYTGEIIMGLEPSVRESYTGLRIILALSVILFVISLIFLVYQFTRKFLDFTPTQAWIAALTAEFMAFNISETGELFTWYTGAAVYTFPLIGFLFCLPFSILSFSTSKIRYSVLAAIFGFIGAGGSLEVVGFGCAAYVVLLLMYAARIGIKKSNIKKILFLVYPFVITLIGAIITVAAPGNYVRHDLMEEEGTLNVIPSAFYSTVNLISHVCSLLSSYIIPYAFLLCFVLGALAACRTAIKGKHVLYAILALVFVGFTTCFPVLLGYDAYSLDGLSSVDRVLYTFDFVIALMCMPVGFVLGMYVRGVFKAHKLDTKNELLKSSIVIVALLLATSGTLINNFRNGMTMRIFNDLKNESVENVSVALDDIYKEVARGSGDVTVTRPPFPDTVLYIPAYIDNPDYFANVEVADYYDVDSFTMIWAQNT